MPHCELQICDETQRSVLLLRPDAGCVAWSWKVQDREVLALPAPLPEFLAAARTGGIPLLYPYANRLRCDTFTAAGCNVDLRCHATLKRDGAGRPMHGFLLRWSTWECTQTATTIEARLDWRAHEELMRPYPFAHTLGIRWELMSDNADALLRVTTTVHADGGVDVPWAFGWHPYIALDGAAEITLPQCRAIVLASTGLPLLGAQPTPLLEPSHTAARAGQDDLYTIEPQGRGVITTATRSVSLEFGDDYPFMQVYSPRGVDFASLEPMVAATSALADGTSPLVPAGSSRSAQFVMRVMDRSGNAAS